MSYYEVYKKRQRTENERLRRAKKFSVATGTASGLLGIGALGALGARTGGNSARIGAMASKYGQGARLRRLGAAGEKATLPLTASSLGVGGVGSLNFAAVQNREANKIRVPGKKVSKSMDFGLSGVHQGENIEISKAKEYSTERRRKARLDAYQLGTAGAAGSAAGAGALYGKRALSARKMSNSAANDASAILGSIKDGKNWGKNAAPTATKAIRHAENSAKLMNQSRKAGAKAGGLGAAAVGLGVASHQIGRYKDRGGKSWNKRSWE